MRFSTLHIFNSKLVLASLETAILGVILSSSLLVMKYVIACYAVNLVLCYDHFLNASCFLCSTSTIGQATGLMDKRWFFMFQSLSLVYVNFLV